MAASILTNSSAMVALQTLRTTNKNLESVNNQISTGKKVATAKDSAATFAISKVMESDVSGFKAISESLSLGGATASVASNAADQLSNLLNEIKGKIVGANEENVDRVKLQDELNSLRNQISGVASAAQFNGLNLLSNQEVTTAYTAAGTAADDTGQINVLSSLDRSSSGAVSTSSISVSKQDLSTNAATDDGALAIAAAALTAAGTATANGAANATYTVVGETATAGRTQNIMAGDTYAFEMSVFNTALGAGTFAATDEAVYTAKDGDTATDVAAGLAARMNFALDSGGFNGDFTITSDGAVVTVTNNTATALGASAAADVTLAGGSTSVSGGLELLGQLDISTKDGATAALGAIEGLIQTTIDAQAAFGTSQKRIDLQNEFMSNLVDSFKEGIGALVDADLEEASARLQALQVQQQLGIQALSIANQAPQNILALFR